MSGAITDIENLQRWFYGNGLPNFTLKYQGTGDKTIYRNKDTITDMNDAWEELRHQVDSQAEAGRAQLEVLVYSPGKNNHAIRTNLDIRGGYFNRAMAPQPTGIAGLPAGVGNLDSYIQERIDLALLKKENEELRDQLNSPANGWERILGIIADSPHLSGIAQTLLVGTLGKNNPALMQQAMAAVNGAPTYAGQPGELPAPDQVQGDPQTVFATNIQEAADNLGTDPVTLAVNLNRLIQSNPDIARTLLQTP